MPADTDRLPPPWRDETEVLQSLLTPLQRDLDWAAVIEQAQPWVDAARAQPAPFWALESLLREYPISSGEGLALMRLAEALLRVPDAETAIALTADQLAQGQFDAHAHGPHALLSNLSAHALALSKRVLADEGLLKRLGAHTVVAAAVRAIQLLGRQFVLGRSIEEARGLADAARNSQPMLRYSYDMLGEGARTQADAQRYLASYLHALHSIAGQGRADSPHSADGMSIKLSALFARYEDAQRTRVFAELIPRAWQLLDVAARANLNLTLDAEESERLELSLDVFEALAQRVAREHPQWEGFGLAIQAYQTRALQVVDAAAGIARRLRLRTMLRLVKGAYWDSEIKRAQELGLAGYPVYTHKHHTDVSYLACVRALLDHAEVIYPQFATHNAGTIAAIAQMARGTPFELQRLHGMGAGVYREVMRDSSLAVRVYAPVGEHRDLLAYLVRRLLENGANSSFVHQLNDDAVPAADLLASPLHVAATPALPLPSQLYAPRVNSTGVDLACAAQRAPLLQAIATARVDAVAPADTAQIDAAMQRLQRGFASWDNTALAQRCHILQRAGDMLQDHLPQLCGLLVLEARKTLPDAVAEVREAIDFCRYYAQQAQAQLAPQLLPGPTGERNELRMRGRGVFVCISPWNFPLAIFVGQVAAALAAGNSVAAKPAEQTPAIAQRALALLHAAGIPEDACMLLHGPGETVGAALVREARTAGVCFTGSTAVAKTIQRALAAHEGPIVPLIAETGGINAMIVDSSALPEQVIDAVLQSAFRSAGQRCSALRLLCLHDAVADATIEMLRGALHELSVGDAARLSTDVGPVIDAAAQRDLQAHIARLHATASLIGAAPLGADAQALLIAPVAFELPRIADLRAEVFGPVLHVVRWRGAVDLVVDEINALGYGLTLGVHTRIDSRAGRIAERARVGNVYVNRNMIGAVVGVQPFGGEGLSGSGPKAGGPHYLMRFCAEQTLTINTAAAGGNAALLSEL